MSDQLPGQMSIYDFPEYLPRFDYRDYMTDHPEELKTLNTWYQEEYTKRGDETETHEKTPGTNF